ncbi:hypothetical protein CJ030_MR1G008538 [Morella rubra]|uniref:Uncharacterized protein n=1 Tax=Morella rubra TaxID=262757 RepID=A0A6A1WLR4_9ROSI|nr:hypothetical protein CJ030_MR1G008538 [Morella rubra]
MAVTVRRMLARFRQEDSDTGTDTEPWRGIRAQLPPAVRPRPQLVERPIRLMTSQFGLRKMDASAAVVQGLVRANVVILFLPLK